jgi:hypothetical protein
LPKYTLNGPVKFKMHPLTHLSPPVSNLGRRDNSEGASGVSHHLDLREFVGPQIRSTAFWYLLSPIKYKAFS